MNQTKPFDLAKMPFTHPHANALYAHLVVMMDEICEAGVHMKLMPVEPEAEQLSMTRQLAMCYSPPGFLGNPIMLLSCHKFTEEGALPPMAPGTPENPLLFSPTRHALTKPASEVKAVLKSQEELIYAGANLGFVFLQTKVQKCLDRISKFAMVKLTGNNDVITLRLRLLDEVGVEESISLGINLLWATATHFNSTELVPKEEA